MIVWTRGRPRGCSYVYRKGKRRLLGHGCGYYVLAAGGRENQLGVVLNVILVKLRRAKKGEEKRKDTEDRKGDLGGSIIERRNVREEIERDGLGGRPRPRPDK